MRWLELSVEADVEAVEAVSEVLGRVAQGTAVHPTALVRDPNDELAVHENVDAPYVVTAHIADDAEAAGLIDATERALWHLQAFGLRPMGGLRVRAVDDASWVDAWKQHYVPQRVGRVVIVPSWIDEPLAAGEVGITLDPGMAFGTGLHPTTRGCLTLLQQVAPMPSEVLDVGSGSGILAIAALRLGAGRAVCLDTDTLAVQASTENARRNGLGDRLEAREGSLAATAERRYPLVLANLVAAVLVELAPRLAAHTDHDGVLLASGIIAPRAGEVLAALAVAGFGLEARLDDGEWVSLRLRHGEAAA
jgi:ribosomal protein L11 methyltransferase